MDDDLISFSEQRFSRSMSKPVSGAGDEDMSPLIGVRRRRRSDRSGMAHFNGLAAD
jgi:hypothetical protein